MIVKIKLFLFMLCSILLISGCGDNSSSDDSYRLVDTLGKTLELIEPSGNITVYNTVRVKNDDSCGSAALASILNYLFGYSISESEAIENLMIYGNHGQNQPEKFTFDDMRLYVESLGQRAFGYTYEDLCSFEAFSEDEISTVSGAAFLPIQIDGYRHYAVLQGYDENYVYFSSPSEGKICFSYPVFCAVNYSKKIFVVWADGVSPLAKGALLPPATFKRFL